MNFEPANDVVAVTGEEPEDLIRELVRDHNIEPGKLTCRNGVVEGFSIYHPKDKHVTIRVKRALSGDIVGEQPDDRKSWSEKRHTDVLNWIEKLLAEVTPKFGLSRYNDQTLELFDRFRRGPRCGLIKDFSGNCLGIDVVRAYTYLIQNITEIPVFSKFDRLVKKPIKRKERRKKPIKPMSYEQLAKILGAELSDEEDDENPRKKDGKYDDFDDFDYKPEQDIFDEIFYLVEIEKPDHILFSQDEDLVPGSVLRYANECGIKYKVRARLKPHKVHKIDPADVIDEMYKSDLRDDDKKYVANLAYGLAARRNNKAAFGELFQDEEEAKAYSDGKMMVNLAPDLYLVVDQVTRELSEGYRPVAALILNEMRILLHKIVSALGESAIAVRTDCVYTTLSKEEARQRLSSFTFGECIGNLRFVEDATPPEGKLRTLKIKDKFDISGMEFPNQIFMKDEFDDDEAKRIIESDGEPILITGKYPGSGKSRLALHWGNRRKDMLVVCPTNVLCDDILRQGYTAITTHKLLGRKPRGSEEEEKFEPFDVSEYKVILFEEIYFYPVFQLEWLYDFMKSNEDKLFIANGDPAQNEPVGQTLNVNFDAYYERIMRQLFPRRLNLQIPKRYAPKDRKKMTRFYDELLRSSENEENPFDIAKKYLPVVSWETLHANDDAARHPHVAFTNESVDRVNRWAQTKIRGTMDWKVGDVAIGKTWARIGKNKINSNSEYFVTEITESQMTVKGRDGILRNVKREQVHGLFKRNWCRTGHSIQGRTIGEKLYIHDPDSYFATARWLRTAITRCQTMDITLVTFRNPCHMSHRVIRQRIKNHVIADKKKGRTFNIEDFVTEEWARKKIKMQGYNCAVCLEPLDLDWSIDRIDNSRAHVKDNCQISCRKCQLASGHR